MPAQQPQPVHSQCIATPLDSMCCVLPCAPGDVAALRLLVCGDPANAYCSVAKLCAEARTLLVDASWPGSREQLEQVSVVQPALSRAHCGTYPSAMRVGVLSMRV
jgi:hypothetical protein